MPTKNLALTVGSAFADCQIDMIFNESSLPSNCWQNYLQSYTDFLLKIIQPETFLLKNYARFGPLNLSFGPNKTGLNALATGDVDIFSEPLTITAERFENFTFANPYIIYESCFYFQNQITSVDFDFIHFLRPFKLETWILLKLQISKRTKILSFFFLSSKI